MFAYQRIFIVDFEANLSNTLKEIGYFSLVLASFFTLIFIVTKNNLTNKNSLASNLLAIVNEVVNYLNSWDINRR